MDFTELCREKNLRLTSQRIEIYNSLARDLSHPNADKVYQNLKNKNPSLSFDTVNRTLHLFAEQGIIKVVADFGKTRQYDSNTKLHHHFCCKKCGKIIDFESSACDELEIPENLSRKLHIISKIVVLEGLCDKCKK